MRFTHETRHEPVAGPDQRVEMVREDLEEIPRFGLPEGYTIRWFEAGDEAHWLRIHRECEGYGELGNTLFEEQYGDDLGAHRARIAFVCGTDGRPVATGSAWMNDWRGMHWGRLHWIATVRTEQGKGLTKPLMTVLCERMKALGHVRAHLTTNTLRVRAIALYAQFGFRAYWETEAEREAWEEAIEVVAGMGREVGKAGGEG